jgi:maltodextrin utilization protein YvdJ
MSDPQFGDTFAYDDFDLIQTSDETQSDKSDDDNLNTTDTTTNMHQKKEDQNSVKSTKKELELTKTDNFEFIITFEKDTFPIELPKTSTIKDLKLAISRTLHILPEHQQIDGFNIPWENLSDEVLPFHFMI